MLASAIRGTHDEPTKPPSVNINVLAVTHHRNTEPNCQLRVELVARYKQPLEVTH